MTPSRPVVVWIEDDLRLGDHAALQAAARQPGPVLPVFVWNGGVGWAEGAASQWWLHHSLTRLHDALVAAGPGLVVRRGDPEAILPDIASSIGAQSVYHLERPDPHRRRRDARVHEALAGADVTVRVFGGPLLHDPDRVRTGQGGPYRVFTPFYRRFLEEVRIDPPEPPARFDASHRLRELPPRCTIDELGLLPDIDWAGGLRATWTPGEAGASRRLAEFGPSGAAAYERDRNIPGVEGTSRLSPHLHFGELSPRQAWFAVAPDGAAGGPAAPYLRQLVWREFAWHLMHHFPHTRSEPLRPEYAGFPWEGTDAQLHAWQRGLTGYPIVDAGMRELWHTGWMHNRVRMIVASFLTKDLLIPWQAGQAWFADTLIDADLANNALGWQWAAGCGADAQPFFRIFNPVAQGRRFDADGTYVRRWVPELAELPNKHLHAPWEAPERVLAAADVTPGSTYPEPIVDHAQARLAALDAYRRMRND